MQRKKAITVVLSILVLLTVLVYGVKYSQAFAKGEMQFSGKLQADTIKVTARNAGVVKQLPVNGAVLTKNLAAVKIENLDFANAVFKAQAELEVANARLNLVKAGTKLEDKAVLLARVSNGQVVVTGVEKALAEAKQAISKLQQDTNTATGSLTEYIANLDKILQEHAGHQGQPGHVHEPQADGTEGMDCAQLLADIENIKSVLNQMNQLAITTDKLSLQVSGISLQAQIATLQMEVGNLKTKFIEAKKDVELAKAQLKAANAGPRPEDVEMAHSQVKEAEVNLALAKKKLEETNVLSPINGLVVQRSVNLEQYVNPGELLLNLADLDNMWVEITLNQTVYGLKAGDLVKVTAKSVPNKEFLGKIETISLPDNGAGSLVKIKVDDSEGILRPGIEMQVFVNNQ